MLELAELFILFLIIEAAYIFLGRRLGLATGPSFPDRPRAVPGGGIVLLPAINLAIFSISNSYLCYSLTAALYVLGIVSYIDDLHPLSVSLRIIVQTLCTASCLYFVHILFPGLIWAEWPMLIITAIFIIGFTNIYNFMDGINGITALYSLAVIIPMTALGVNKHVTLPIIAAIAAFAIFNVRRKALVFAGDVGAILLGASIAVLMLAIPSFPASLTLASLYITDSVLTILARLIKKENIFRPHREHLYQLLVHRLGIPQLYIAVAYALLQLLINVGFIMLPSGTILWVYTVAVFIILAIAWKMIRSWALKFNLYE